MTNKFEARNPKSETMPNFQNSNFQNFLFRLFEHSDFGFVSNFDIRISDLRRDKNISVKVIKLIFILVAILSCRNHIYADENSYARLREEMVKNQITARGITDKRVIEVMSKVARHNFVPLSYRKLAYSDGPLPIGEGQTISQPYIVALMTELLGLKGEEKVLEIGTGSGYQAAILAELVKEVYTIEIIESLANSAKLRLEKLGYKNIIVKYGDGYLGWPEFSPFDAIIVTAAPDHIPQPLVEQLKIGGKMVIPVGQGYQELLLVTKTEKGIEIQKIIPVIFVPLQREGRR